MLTAAINVDTIKCYSENRNMLSECCILAVLSNLLTEYAVFRQIAIHHKHVENQRKTKSAQNQPKKIEIATIYQIYIIRRKNQHSQHALFSWSRGYWLSRRGKANNHSHAHSTVLSFNI